MTIFLDLVIIALLVVDKYDAIISLYNIVKAKI